MLYVNAKKTKTTTTTNKNKRRVECLGPDYIRKCIVYQNDIICWKNSLRPILFPIPFNEKKIVISVTCFGVFQWRKLFERMRLKHQYMPWLTNHHAHFCDGVVVGSAPHQSVLSYWASLTRLIKTSIIQHIPKIMRTVYAFSCFIEFW